MKKTLVYHLYMVDGCLNNIVYWLHIYCLRKYIHIFDKLKITICLDDLERHDLIGYGYEWVNSLGANCETEIRVVKNDEMGESRTFEHEILNMNNDGMVFFAHSKGITRVIDNQLNQSVFLWLLCLYFQNLEYVNEVEHNFLDMPLKQDCFYGTLLMGSVRNEPLKNAFGMHFSGNFYWVNMPKYKNLRKLNKVPELELTGRWFAEMYPGMVFNREMMGGGLRSRNDVWFEMEDVQVYKMSKEEWEDIFTIYGDVEKMNGFVDDVTSFIGEEHIDKTNKTEWDDKV